MIRGQVSIKLVFGVCEGTGGAGSPLLEKTGSQLVGIDLSDEILDAAIAKLSSYKRKLDLVIGDDASLPFASNTFGAMIYPIAVHSYSESEGILGVFSGAN